MDFKQGLPLGQRLEQRLVMTQQLQQAIRLLQLSRTELAESIQDALSENPLLEEAARAVAGIPAGMSAVDVQFKLGCEASARIVRDLKITPPATDQ